MPVHRLQKRIVARLEDARRRCCERFGIDRYSRPARDDLEEKLSPRLPVHGFFFEAGAFDGFRESNTYYLERIRRWRGILVEPVGGIYQSCLRLRPAAKVFRAALVGRDHPNDTVVFNYQGLMNHALQVPQPDDRSEREGLRVEAPARTISSILAESGDPLVDFMSLELEGGEADALRGLDLTAHRPRAILIECRTARHLDAVASLLRPLYDSPIQLTRHDYLFLIVKS